MNTDKFSTSENRPSTGPKFSTLENRPFDEQKFSTDIMNHQPTKLTDLFDRIESSGNTNAEVIECGVIHCGGTIDVYPLSVDIFDLGFGNLKHESVIATFQTTRVIRGIQKYCNMRYNQSTKEILFSDGRKMNT